jgi:hypothetical protein
MSGSSHRTRPDGYGIGRVALESSELRQSRRERTPCLNARRPTCDFVQIACDPKREVPSTIQV